jgi:kynurenine 3-monooxygenase
MPRKRRLPKFLIINFPRTLPLIFIVRATNCAQDSSSLVLSTGDEADMLCDLENEPTTITANLLIGADGSARTIANFMELSDSSATVQNPLLNVFLKRKRFKVTRYVDDNQRVYKTIPIQLPSGWRYDLNYSARTSGGNLNLDALPSNRFGSYCAVLLFKAGDPLAVADCDPADLRQKLDEYMPQFSNLIDDETLQIVAKKGPSYLPSFRYVGPRLHQGRTVILGDCAHTVKPYFGLGANTALQDVSVLSDAFDESPPSNVMEALALFSKKRAGESKAIVQMSRELDRPGKLGLLTFVFPLILDSIFHRLAPKLFAPSTLSMFSLEGYDFRKIRARKRLDRAMQVTLISTTLALVSRGAVLLFKILVKALLHGNSVVAKTLGGALSTTVVFSLVRRKASQN